MGLGAIGHTFVANAREDVQVDVLTSSKVEPFSVTTTDGATRSITDVYTYDEVTLINHDYLIVTLPYVHRINRMRELVGKVSDKTTIVIVPANQGAYYYLPKELRSHKLILTERVLQIARIDKKYESVKVFGTRKDMHIASVNGADISEYTSIYPKYGDVNVHENHEDISLISSNATIHSARVYEMFALNNSLDQEFLFYEDWNDVTSKYFVGLENEVLQLVARIEEVEGIKLDVYDMYRHFKIEAPLIENTTKKISEFPGFKGITFYAKDMDDLINNRYVADDCILAMDFYLALGRRYNVALPYFEEIHNWALDITGKKPDEMQYMELD